MIGGEKMRDSVKDFAEAMEAKLKTHDKDRGKHGWVGCDLYYLHARMREELYEYSRSVRDSSDGGGDMDELLDVANFAMMLWDNLRRQNGQYQPTIEEMCD